MTAVAHRDRHAVLWDSIDGTAGGSLHCWDGGGFTAHSWAALWEQAGPVAARLRAAGVRPGTRVACVLTNTVATVRGVLAVWSAGGIVASLPLVSRGMSVAEYASALADMVRTMDSPLLLLDERFVALVPDDVAAGIDVRSWESLAVGSAPAIEPALPGPDELAFVQYSSGSTAVPKGCELTARAIDAQMRLLHRMLGATDGAEHVVSWLPLSHDMGMFGCLLHTMARAGDLTLSTPERFMLSPRTWFADMARVGATMTAGTSTGLHLAVKAQGSRPPGPGLESLRACVVGAERVDLATLDRAAATFAPAGLRRSAFMPAYGLAEATLAVTASGVHEEPRAIHLDTDQLGLGRAVEVAPGTPGATAVTSTGRPCAGVTVRTLLPDELSEIEVVSPSLARGYAGDPDGTAARFVDGVLRTGDLGLLRDGELYVLGRKDDLLPVGGRNVYARQAEAAIESTGVVRRGCCVLVDVPGAGVSSFVLVAEPANGVGGADQAEVAASVVLRSTGVALDRCVFVKRHTLPKTPSGKIQRFRVRTMLTSGQLTPTSVIELG